MAAAGLMRPPMLPPGAPIAGFFPPMPNMPNIPMGIPPNPPIAPVTGVGTNAMDTTIPETETSSSQVITNEANATIPAQQTNSEPTIRTNIKVE